jgi:hypothetical protein
MNRNPFTLLIGQLLQITIIIYTNKNNEWISTPSNNYRTLDTIILKNDLKVEKFPEGAMVYIVEEYDENNEIYYRLGKTDDMNKRIKIYNTHSIHKKEVVHYQKILDFLIIKLIKK